MRDASTGEVRIIDLEYGGLNYAAFDVANHFMEWAGGTGQPQCTLGCPDWSRLPTSAEKIKWISEYMGDTGKLAPYLEFVAQVDLFMIVDNFYWGLWAVCQAITEGCHEFPYLVYAKSRLRKGLIDAGALVEADSPEFGVAMEALTSTSKNADGAEKLYDEWAETYDAVLRSWGYTAPEMCVSLLEEVCPEDANALFDCADRGPTERTLLPVFVLRTEEGRVVDRRGEERSGEEPSPLERRRAGPTASPRASVLPYVPRRRRLRHRPRRGGLDALLPDHRRRRH